MTIKHLLPLSFRDYLRPAYQRACGYGRTFRETLVTSPSWPKPRAWHELRSSLKSITDLGELYRIANREFGVFQIEEEIVPFLEYVRSCQPRTIGEIGILFGGNTFLFQQTLTEMKRQLAIDIKLHNVAKARFLARRGQRLHMLEGSSYSPNMINSVQSWLGADRFDFLFIDGDHEYEGVRADFLAYYDLVRPGGLIAFHDIVPDEFARTGQRTSGSQCYGGGVYRLWQELRDRFPHREFVQSWDQNGFGIGVITKPDNGRLPDDLNEKLQVADRNHPMSH